MRSPGWRHPGSGISFVPIFGEKRLRWMPKWRPQWVGRSAGGSRISRRYAFYASRRAAELFRGGSPFRRNAGDRQQAHLVAGIPIANAVGQPHDAPPLHHGSRAALVRAFGLSKSSIRPSRTPPRFPGTRRRCGSHRREVDPGLVAFKLAPYRRVFCVAPGYLARYATPAIPEELSQHNCLIGRGATLNASWPIRRGDTIESVRVSGNFVANNGEVVRDAALAGLGIAMTARWLVEEDLRARRLVEVLNDYAPSNRAIYAVLPRQGSLSPKVRAFVDFLNACCHDIH